MAEDNLIKQTCKDLGLTFVRENGQFDILLNDIEPHKALLDLLNAFTEIIEYEKGEGIDNDKMTLLFGATKIDEKHLNSKYKKMIESIAFMYQTTATFHKEQ